MSASTFQERFTQELYQVLEETFENVHGIYLDKGTSLGETLAGLTAQSASQPISPRCTTIAAHVAHLIFYLNVVERSLRGEEVGSIDWEQTWLTRTVTPDEWTQLQQQLTQTYQRLLATLRGLGTWEGKDTIGDAMSTVIHTAYHLGAIRLALCTVE